VPNPVLYMRPSITHNHIDVLRGFHTGDTHMKLVTLHIPETYVEGLEKLVDSNLYPNRSEAIRIAIRDLLKRELWS
jgi:antitoxin ParD1/3/4